jgi:hypothetical protein
VRPSQSHARRLLHTALVTKWKNIPARFQMKSKSSPRPFFILRRLSSIVPMRYRCAALLISTIFFFPFILLAMGIGVLGSVVVDGIAVASRWVGDAAGFSQGAKLRDLPPSSASAPNLPS